MERKKESLLANIKLQEKQIGKLFNAIEPLRLEKVRAMRKCNFPAWKLQPVECIGKRGGNYVFLSKI